MPSVPGYRALEELGRGGMGVVYKARPENLNRLVALKMILAGDMAGPEASARFFAEAEAVARLQHPRLIERVTFSPDGLRLATSGWNGMVTLRDVRTGRDVLLLWEAKHPGHSSHPEE